MYAPSYSLNSHIVDKCNEIIEFLDETKIPVSDDSVIKKSNIRSVSSTLIIEGIILSFDDMTDLLNGKTVSGPIDDINAVMNTYEVYNDIGSFSSRSKRDLTMVQRTMMANVVPDEHLGIRKVPVGIFDSRSGRMVYRAPEPTLVKPMINSMFGWYGGTDLHPLISSAIMHFQIEHIHPFADGNGRTGRFWQKLILSEWSPVFLRIPFEYNILRRRREYYDVLQRCDDGDCTEFIEYSLDIIAEALKSIPEV